MLISLQSDLKKRIRLSLIMDLANDSIGSSECRDSTIGLISTLKILTILAKCLYCENLGIFKIYYIKILANKLIISLYTKSKFAKEKIK